MSGPRTYFDYNATTPVLPQVLDAMLPYLTDAFGNASSVHTEGQRARAAVEQARSQVASLLSGNPKDVVFTAGATGANNLALRGVVHSRRSAGAAHVVCTEVEHPSVLETVRALEAAGHPVSWIGVDTEGRLDTEGFVAALRDDTAVATAMLANNETGVLFPVPALAEASALRGVPFHSDCVQGASTLDLGAQAAGSSLRSVSAHKIGGPKGVGALLAPRKLKLGPILTGGHQERGLFAGTENVAAIVGFGRAAELAVASHADTNAHTQRLRDRLEATVRATIPGAHFNGSQAERLPSTVNVSFDDTEGETLLVALDVAGFAVSSGSACTAGSLEPSHVLLAMGLSRERARAAIRISLGATTTDDDVDRLVAALPRAVADIRALAPARKVAP